VLDRYTHALPDDIEGNARSRPRISPTPRRRRLQADKNSFPLPLLPQATPLFHARFGSDDPEAASPPKQYLTAAEKAGIDLELQDALKPFVAGSNARSAAG
jgi:hypothetical protein